MSFARKLGALFSGELLPVARVQGLGAQATKSTVTSGDVDSTVNIRRVGQVVRSVFQSDAANTVISATIPSDNTVPQNTEGTQVLTATITPTSASSILERWRRLFRAPSWQTTATRSWLPCFVMLARMLLPQGLLAA